MKPYRSTLPLLLVAPALLPVVGAIASNPSLLRDPSDLRQVLQPAGDPLITPAVRGTAPGEDPSLASDEPASQSGNRFLDRPATTSSTGSRADLIALDRPNPPARRPVQPPPDPEAPSAVVRFGDTLLKISQRYGLSMAELLRLNPGLDTARLVVGSQIQVARSSPGGTHMLLGLVPSVSGGASYPDTPRFGDDRRDGSGRFTGMFSWPAEGTFTSGYGWRWGRMHKGIDIANNVGTPIMAAARGQVTFSGWHNGGYGYLVEITHDDGTLTRYAHNSALLVEQGQHVEQGQVISRMGSTGRSTGPHLHFEVVPPGEGAMNPLLFLPPRA